MTSVAGRIVPAGWPLRDHERRQYAEVHARYEPDAWLLGRGSVERRGDEVLWLRYRVEPRRAPA